MVLYAASILEAAVPVKGKGKKKVDLESETIEAPVVKKEKRPLTDKQKAHLVKMAEARKAKKAAAEVPKEEPEPEKTEPVVKKTVKRKKAETVKEAIDAAVETLTTETVQVAAVEEPVVKKIRTRKPKVTVDPTEAPPWFKRYLEGVSKEKAEQSDHKKPKKQIVAEANAEANAKWNDGLTRDRVNHEVSSHMTNMYTSIFGDRKL